MRKIVIVSTKPDHGGSLVLHLLNGMLLKKGLDTRILLVDYLPIPDKNLRLIKFFLKNIAFSMKRTLRKILEFLKITEPLYNPIPCKLKRIPFVSKKTIVIYPELVYGNPLRAKNVVRWFLFHNRFPEDSAAYSKDELVFSYREHFNDYNLNPTCRLLKLNYFNSELYKQTNFGEREGVCYIIRKGKNRKDLPKVFDGPIIDDLSEKEKVAVFNRCKYCYDYDTQTFYASIACVCGCIPVVMMEPGKTKSDYLGKGDFDYGKAYGDTPEEIEYAIKTRPERLKMLDYREKNEKNVDFFIQEIEKRFGSN